MHPVRFLLNGTPVAVHVAEGERLLETLRERLGIVSVKDGCHPQGQCGACLAIVNGRARVTCTEPTQAVDGGEVLTLEGLDPAEKEQIVRAFTGAAAGQCGYCLPAIALHAHTFVAKHPHATRAEIARGLDMHLCRCGGYGRILDAMEMLAALRRGDPVPDPTPAKGGVGDAIAKRDTADLVLGEREFVADLKRHGMGYGALVLAAHARARVLGVDVSEAVTVPGVVRAIVAADVPGARFQGLLERDWPVLVAAGEEVRCAGDVLAIVVAESPAIARDAAKRVRVAYSFCAANADGSEGAPLAPVLTFEQATDPAAPRVNPAYANVLSRSAIRRGDVDAALASAAFVVAETFTTQRVEHLFLETEAALAEPAGGGVRVWSQGQGIFDDRRQIASILNVREEDVAVTLVPAGGAFGGKEDLLVQGHAALAAHLTQRPVLVAIDRDMSVRMHPKRHPMRIEMRAGCDAEGRLLALRARILGDTGAYASVGAKVLERAAGHACGPYNVPNVDVEAIAFATNHPPSGAMRGFGVPQVTFALEGCLDRLAALANIDPWEIRFRNAVRPGDPLTSGQTLRTSCGIVQTLLAVKPAYASARAAGRAVGLACGVKNSGLGNGADEVGLARLVVRDGGKIALLVGFTEMGQGLWTALAQIAAEATGLDVARFDPMLDTSAPLACGQTTGSRAVLLGGRAVLRAAAALRRDLDAGGSLASLAGRSYDGAFRPATTDPLGSKGDPRTHTSYGFATQLVILDAQGHVARVVAAHDVGRAINPSLCEAQVEGAIVMGLGYALTEDLPCEEGIPVTSSVRALGALRARDVPDIEVMLIEDPDPEGPFGAKGVGEIGLVPTAAAVASALAAFDGVRRTALPMRDSPAARAMHVVHGPGLHGHGPHAHAAQETAHDPGGPRS